ncbi:hypothetical protein [Thermocrispum municipale]|uniref:hypothetical protein n=1 Tax=Thermocrispum municipale TaxID=37926 RepID=UPI0004031E41|nr:hypothetical protein [Thermocrispum municipale]
MTWNSGPCTYLTGGAAYIVTDACPEVVRIGDDEVRQDERERVALDEGVGFPPVERGLYQS